MLRFHEAPALIPLPFQPLPMEIYKTKAEAEERLGAEVMSRLSDTVSSYVLPHSQLATEMNLIGGFGTNDVQLPDGTVRNLWVEFGTEMERAFGLIPVATIKIRAIYVYDGDMPDEILDRFNKIKANIEYQLH